MNRNNIFTPVSTPANNADEPLPPATNGRGGDLRSISLHLQRPREATNADGELIFRSMRSTLVGTSDSTARPQQATATALATKGKTWNNRNRALDEACASDHITSKNGALDIYNHHFGLTSRPFTLVPDPDFLFWSSAHRQAYTMLDYGALTGGPITLITGEVGAGKTTLLHKFLEDIGENAKIGLISNSQGCRGELLRWVLMALDQTAERDATYVDLFDAFQKYLISEYAAGKRVILIFDEAQNLSVQSLEELRMFTNINSNKDELLQLVLVGQPELRDTIHRSELRQLAQRVAASFHLGVMNQKTVAEYILHRLRVAGAHRNLFPEAACQRIYENTGGVPRLVNQLCDLAMLYAFTKNQKTVTLTTVDNVLADGVFFCAGAFSKETAI